MFRTLPANAWTETFGVTMQWRPSSESISYSGRCVVSNHRATCCLYDAFMSLQTLCWGLCKGPSAKLIWVEGRVEHDYSNEKGIKSGIPKLRLSTVQQQKRYVKLCFNSKRFLIPSDVVVSTSRESLAITVEHKMKYLICCGVHVLFCAFSLTTGISW